MTTTKPLALNARRAWQAPKMIRIAGGDARMPGLVAVVDEGLAKGS